MLERRKMERGAYKIVDTESLVPKDHLLRKVDAAVDFNKIYDMVEPLYCQDNRGCIRGCQGAARNVIQQIHRSGPGNELGEA